MAKKANGEGSVFQRSDGRWQGAVTVGFSPSTGKQIKKVVYGKTKKEALQKIRTLIDAVENGTYKEPTRMMVSEWMTVWVDTYNQSVKHNTREKYRCDIRNHIIPGIGQVKLVNLTAPIIQRWYNSGLVNASKGKPASAKSIKNIHGVLHKALAKAVQLGYINSNPCDACDLPRVEKPGIKPIEGEALKQFLNAIKGDFYENEYFFTLFSGLREGEVIGLTWECVDFEKKTILVKQQISRPRKFGGGEVYQFAPLKNDKVRTVNPAPAVFKMLSEIKKAQNTLKLSSGGAWSNEWNLVFVNEDGSHLRPSTLYNHFKRCAAKAGIPNARFHDLRHTFATLMLQEGVDIKTVSDSLGHATVAFTLDVYGHTTEQMKQESANRMQALLEKLS